MAKGTLKTAMVAVIALGAGLALAGSGLLGSAQAQSQGGASGVICLLGQELNGFAPICLVDVREQTILVYEYSYSNDQIQLTCARTYQFDKLLKDFHTGSPSVEDVRKEVTRR